VPNYIVDPTLFHAEGAILNWALGARRLGLLENSVLGNQQAPQPVIELRWMTHASLGLPTEPFQVWARPHDKTGIDHPLNIKQQTFMFAGNVVAVTWSDGTMTHVTATVQAPAGGSVFAFAGAPLLSNFVTFASVPAGSSVVVELSAPLIEGLIFSPGITVTGVTGIEVGALSQAAGWHPIELVGLPVGKADWNGIGKHGEPEGLTGAFTDAQTAAIQRLKRGAPPFGWAPNLAAGVPAPPWAAPDYNLLVKEMNATLLDQLKAIAQLPPEQQAAKKINVVVPPPQNSSGQAMNVPDGTSQVAPLSMLLMAASTDPFLNLVLGYGTAYPYQSDFNIRNTPRFDYMITAHFENGLNGESAPADFAALVPLPGVALAPPPPANLVTTALGMLRPLHSDQSWRGTTRLSWDRPPSSQIFRTASVAAARAGITPHTATGPLLEKRQSGGFRYIVINNATTTPPDPEAWRIHVIDHELPVPTNPGSMQLKYGAAVQDIYGQWTPWSTVDASLQQPDLEGVRIASAALHPTLPAVGTSCPASLVFEFFWDWRVRSPQQVKFVGTLFAASSHGDPPPSLAIPGGLAHSIGGAQPPFVITFNGGDTPGPIAGATIEPLNEAGDAKVTFGTAQGINRRYRVTLTGLSLDFGPTGHVGMALWAQGQEHILPQRASAWSDHPTVVSTSDPRPPVVPIFYVLLGSLPDASGQSHAQLKWTAQPNAAGYFVYEASETSILVANNLPQPNPSQTLSDRLLIVRNAFHSNPSRTQFTRLNSTLLKGTSTDIAMPRGSTSIHLYVVLGVSAGQVESEWPCGPHPEDALMAIAAPHIMNPATPTIEVTSFLDSAAMPAAYKAKVTIGTRPGPRVRKIDLHRVRVDDAAKELDTMGPPIARLTASGSGWTVTSATDSSGSFIAKVEGTDAPTGSWRRVWYRATAWTDQDPARGGLPGRSPASNAAWVVLPPTDPPVLSALHFGAGPTAPDFIVEWTSASPLKKTPLGPHKIAVRASVAGAPPNTPPLFALDTTLDKVATAAPVTSGVWIASAPGVTPVTYRALIRRAAITDAVKFAVRITDPIGRTGEQVATILSGPVNPAPDLSALKVTKLGGVPPHVLLAFTSAVPLVAPLDGPYVIRVVVTFKKVIIFLPAPTRVLELPAGSVPTSPHPPGPAPDLQIVRSAGTGPLYTYTVSCTGEVVGFEVKITAHDGRFVDKTQVVS
jgi:hypothetical protein